MKYRYRSAERTRASIVKAVTEKPGQSAPQVAARLLVTERTVRRHAGWLIRHKQLSSDCSRGRMLLYVRGPEIPSPDMQRFHSILSDPEARAVYESLENEGTTPVRLVQKTALGRFKVLRELEYLQKAGLAVRLDHSLWQRVSRPEAAAVLKRSNFFY